MPFEDGIEICFKASRAKVHIHFQTLASKERQSLEAVVSRETL